MKTGYKIAIAVVLVSVIMYAASFANKVAGNGAVAATPAAYKKAAVHSGKYTIDEFLARVRSHIANGMSPSNAWNTAKSHMYVLDNALERLEAAMVSDNALHCDDSEYPCSSTSGSDKLCGLLLDRNVPIVLTTVGCGSHSQ